MCGEGRGVGDGSARRRDGSGIKTQVAKRESIEWILLPGHENMEIRDTDMAATGVKALVFNFGLQLRDKSGTRTSKLTTGLRY